MRTIKIMCAVAGLMISGVAFGQGSPFPGEIQGNYARIKANVLKAADKMPPESYSFKPTPDIRTFARVVNHVTEAQMHICGAANGTASSDAKMPAETADKAAIVEALKASFAECDKAYAGLTDANEAELLAGLGPVKRSRLTLLWGNVAHDNEQYATLSLYLRLKGIVPPSSEK
jgi:uncharacterized damage-inducible protein DinB